MEKKVFKTVEEVADYFNENFDFDEGDIYEDLDKVKVEGYETEINRPYTDTEFTDILAYFVPENGKGEVKYLWNDDMDNEEAFLAKTIKNKEIGEQLSKYGQYISSNYDGYIDFETWLLNSGVDLIDYDVFMEFQRFIR